MPAARGPYRVDLQNPISSHPLNRGLVSWWLPLSHLIGGRRLWDLRNRFHGTLENFTAGAGEWMSSPSGFGSLLFDGSNDRVDCGSAINSFVSGTAITWEASIYLAGSGTRIVSRNDGGAGGVGNGYAFRVNTGIQIEIYPTVNSTTGTTTLTNGVWYHVAGTYQGSSAIKVYVNGKLETTNTTGIQPSLSAGGGNLYHGTYGSGEYFSGRIGFHRIHNRVLSEAEIAASYQEWLAGFPNLLRRYPERSWFVLRESAAAAGTTIPVFAHHYRMQGIQ